MYDYSTDLLALPTEVCEIGHSIYELEQLCPGYQPNLDECWQRLDYLDAEIQRFIPMAEQLHYFQYRIERHLSFGESLEDLG